MSITALLISKLVSKLYLSAMNPRIGGPITKPISPDVLYKLIAMPEIFFGDMSTTYAAGAGPASAIDKLMNIETSTNVDRLPENV